MNGSPDVADYALPIPLFVSPEALEKNQQWLAYDQQREAYVKATVDRVSTLEQQLNQADQALSQKHNEALSDGEPEGQWAVGTHCWDIC